MGIRSLLQNLFGRKRADGVGDASAAAAAEAATPGTTPTATATASAVPAPRVTPDGGEAGGSADGEQKDSATEPAPSTGRTTAEDFLDSVVSATASPEPTTAKPSEAAAETPKGTTADTTIEADDDVRPEPVTTPVAGTTEAPATAKPLTADDDQSVPAGDTSAATDDKTAAAPVAEAVAATGDEAGPAADATGTPDAATESTTATEDKATPVEDVSAVPTSAEDAAEPAAGDEGTPDAEASDIPASDTAPPIAAGDEAKPGDDAKPGGDATGAPGPVADVSDAGGEAAPVTDGVDAEAAADDAGPVSDSSGAPAPGSAISLEKVRESAPELVSLYKAAAVSLEKHGLAGRRAAVYLVLDRSGSMRRYYKDGTVQHLAEQVLGLSAHLDDDGTVPVVFFSTDIDGTADVDLENYRGRVEELHGSYGHMGRTNYHRAIEAVVEHYERSGATDPALVVFQTDGAPTSRPAAEKALCEVADKPLFWQFVGFGDPRSAGLNFLRKLDSGLPVPERRKVDNAGFFHAGLEPRELSDQDLYEALTAEFPQWLEAAREAGVLD
ncbi:VWA domain-containing protein [Streptomyces alkaliterrae]|uniref:VWA domain-containing protein n=1 Tax=Streptomyces alkaliterrae TaxID=2213162 RepID=A0A5P0YQL4_9ACTN|nr:VWA domain-containing protein [Streptomyces alkaliterrae]MBB1261277.1 VWA domain-containing protein [Streptomyces alkaliterrae]MQS02548.1 VWA domain-containing protein [Streptomyces alkaliterrae]